MLAQGTRETNHEQLPKKHDFDLYQALLEELRHLHNVWINNFRVILSFNAILLPATFAILVFVTRQEISPEYVEMSYLVLVVLSALGILVTSVGVMVVRRIKMITVLRYREVRRLEAILSTDISISPFSEGFSFLGYQSGVTTPRTGSEAIHPSKHEWGSGLPADRMCHLPCIYSYLGVRFGGPSEVDHTLPVTSRGLAWVRPHVICPTLAFREPQARSGKIGRPGAVERC